MSLIYIVEDDESIREIEEFALMNAGHKVVGFPDAKSFYKKMEDVFPDLILLDVMLPDESGYDIVRKIRKNADIKSARNYGYSQNHRTGFGKRIRRRSG